MRFWETPEKVDVWKELRADGVDLLNTDKLSDLRDFLLKEGQESGAWTLTQDPSAGFPIPEVDRFAGTRHTTFARNGRRHESAVAGGWRGGS